MSELYIKTHNFNKLKEQLKSFSEQTNKDLDLEKVDISGGLFGLGEHKVTGDELNNLTDTIEKHLTDFNKLHTSFIKEFGQVYQIFDVLDKEYIDGIVTNMKAIEVTSDKIKAAQKDIDSSIEIQKKTIQALANFKKKIEGYEHLEDINEIWNDSQNLKEEFLAVSSNLSKVIENMKENCEAVENLQKFKEQIEGLEHIKDIDRLWDNVENFSEKVSEDLKLIDEINGRCDALEKSLELKNEVVNKHESEIELLKNTIKEIQQKGEERTQALGKKTKTAYILAGGSMAIALIELILLAAGVI